MKRIFVLMLSVIVCLSSVGVLGCADKEEKVITLCNFEQWAPDFQTMAVYNRLGKISRNADKNYVFEGDYSAKIQVVGARNSNSIPSMVIPLGSEKFEFSYKDFSEFDTITAQVYNNQDESITVSLGLVSSFDKDRYDKIDSATFTIEPKKWTQINYMIDIDYLSLCADYTSIAGLVFEFEDAGVIYPEDGTQIYLDNVCLNKASSKRQPQNFIELTVTDTYKEICDFERTYQKYVMKVKRGANIDESIETFVVNASDYGIPAASGEKVLRVLRHPYRTAKVYNELQVPETILKACGMNKIPQTAKDYASWYFCFDMYNNDDSRSEWMSLWFSQEGYTKRDAPLKLLQSDRTDMKKTAGQWAGWHEGMYSTYNPKDGDFMGLIRKNGWTTFRISLYELSQGMEMIEYVTNPGIFGISMYSPAGETDWEMFVDNFRLEKGEPLNYVDFGEDA